MLPQNDVYVQWYDWQMAYVTHIANCCYRALWFWVPQASVNVFDLR